MGHFLKSAQRWSRDNLFSSWGNGLLTLVGVGLLYLLLMPLVRWALIDATWVGTTRADCQPGGACWVFIATWFDLLMFGRYPTDQVWRIQTVYGLFGLLAAFIVFGNESLRRRSLAALVLGFPVIAFVMIYGGFFGLPVVETERWGGLFLTLVIASVGMLGSIPLGLLLALGRRSSLTTVKAICTVFIEVVRGIPLITVLFMASVMFPLLLPQGFDMDKLLRAIIGVTLFTAAYMAETIRGGLQAIPKGQYEAAHALGLSYPLALVFVVLPQVFKIIIPGIVNSFISLFKDTSLVYIIGLFDLLGMAQVATQNPNWLGLALEGYVFVGFVFWSFCFAMSQYSRQLERRLKHRG